MIDAIDGAAHVGVVDACVVDYKLLEAEEVGGDFGDGQTHAGSQQGSGLLRRVGVEIDGVTAAYVGAEVAILLAQQVAVVTLLVEEVTDETREAEHLVGRGRDDGDGSLATLGGVGHHEEHA